MATLARLSPAGIAAQLEHSLASSNPACLLMNQFQIFSTLGQAEFALEMQARALQHSLVYRIESTNKPAIRLLAMLGEGDTRDNTPIDYLTENSDIQLDLLYVLPGKPLPDHLPEHDVLLVALGESAKNRLALVWMDQLLKNWPRPVLNPPQRILQLSRDRVYQLLKSIPALLIPPTELAERFHLTQGAPLDYPLTIRPQSSQGGKGLQRLDTPAQLTEYLDKTCEQRFFISRFIDYQSRDGEYRKWRIALIGGEPYLGHLAIGPHWIVHYNTAGMEKSTVKREEEARAMAEFESDFAQRHQAALRAVATRLALDYVVLDCSETTDGKLLLFEADNRGWIHATDPLELFAYKQPAMKKLFAAFRAMLMKTA